MTPTPTKMMTNEEIEEFNGGLSLHGICTKTSRLVSVGELDAICAQARAANAYREALVFAVKVYRGAGPLGEKHLRQMIDNVIEETEALLKEQSQ